MDTATLPKTRAEAKSVGASHYFTGTPCKHGHIAPRKTKGVCTECLKVEWAQAAETRAEYFRKYNHSDEGKEAKRRYYERNKELVIARAAARPVEERRRLKKRWRTDNPLYVLSNNKNRRRKHRQATPPWLTKKQKSEMRELYKIAMTMTKITGIQYVVDHIHPLRSEVLCGLHVPWNLQVLTQEENLAKSNKVSD